jgi:fermentation-respiration switch protein FrsA (DUF1100 family)
VKGLNEEDSGRKGAFLFLDMKKAFDRVSYAFTKRGLKALGFGPNFRKWLGMMYNEDRPPRRRMYVNGSYSEWFDIKSGVAQGCPLSPLLFLQGWARLVQYHGFSNSSYGSARHQKRL